MKHFALLSALAAAVLAGCGSAPDETPSEPSAPGARILGDGLEVAPSPARREPGFSESPAVLASAPSGSSEDECEGQVSDEGSPGDALPPAPAEDDPPACTCVGRGGHSPGCPAAADWPGPDDKIGTECFAGTDFPEDEWDRF